MRATSSATQRIRYDLRKIRDGISMAEGTLPISLEELYEKEKKRPSRSALSLSNNCWSN